MELIYTETPAERLVLRIEHQAEVSGEMPTPDGRAVTRVLCALPNVELSAVKAGYGEVVLEGRVNIGVTAVDADGALFAYRSGASFSHKVECEDALPSMRAEADARVISMNVIPSGAGAQLEADLDFDVRVISQEPIRSCVGIKDKTDDLEIKTVEFKYYHKKTVGSSVIRLREEIAAEEADEVITTDSIVAVKETVRDNDGCTVSGVITISAVTMNRFGHIGQIVRQIPFRERINARSENGDAYCEAGIRSLYLRSLGEEYSILALEAEVSFELYIVEASAANIPQDLFSVSEGIRPIAEKAAINNAMGSVSVQTNLKESVSLPDNMPAVGGVMFAGAFPIINETYCEQGILNVNGVLATSIAYETEYGSKEAYREDVPFSVQIPVEGENTIPRVKSACIADVSSVDERRFHVQYCLIVTAEMIETGELDYISSAEECGLNKSEPCILIVFASQGEEVFDIAKRYSVPCESIRKLNPGITEPLRDGDKLILMV